MGIKMSASYEVYSDLESRRFIVQAHARRLTAVDFVERVTRFGLAKVEELEVLKDAWLAWTEFPGAIFAILNVTVSG